MSIPVFIEPGLSKWQERRQRRQIAEICLIKWTDAILAGNSTRNLPSLVCGAKRREKPCPRRCRAGETRCKWHGGYSTGAKTAAGKARIAAGQAAYYQRVKEGEVRGK